MEIPAINLKAILLVHWLLTVWGCMSLLHSSYAWSNFSVLAVGVWAVAQRDSIDAILMFLIGMTVTILTDIICFGIYFPLFDKTTSVIGFSMGMAILSLILKPVSCFFVYQMYHERGGDYNINFGFPTVTQNRDSYQSIDQPDHTVSSDKPFNQSKDQKHAEPPY